MTDIKNKLHVIVGVALLVAAPEAVFSDNRVPAALMNSNIAGKVHGDQLEHWQKYQWRGGAGFNMPERFKFMTSSSSAHDSQVYTLTEPQRKSVNPWKVNTFNNNRYTSRAVKRPWGRVPDQFNRKILSANYPDQYSVKALRAYDNSAQYKPFSGPDSVFRPNINSHLSNGSNLLFPFAGYLPVNPGRMLINAPDFFYQRHVYPGHYLW